MLTDTWALQKEKSISQLFLGSFFLSIHTVTPSFEEYEQVYIVYTGFHNVKLPTNQKNQKPHARGDDSEVKTWHLTPAMSPAPMGPGLQTSSRT